MKLYALEAVLMHIGKPISRCCDICGWQGKYFKSFFNKRTCMKESTLCPRCGSVDRTRFIHKYMKEQPDDISVLEIGPLPRCQIVSQKQYQSIDIILGRAQQQMSLTKTTFKGNSFDIIICLSVLQNIEDEWSAIKEMHRILKKNGEALIWVPIGYYGDREGSKSIEFGTRMFYGVEGVLRSYERKDFTQKLNDAGFTVDVLPFEMNGGLENEGIIFRATK